MCILCYICSDEVESKINYRQKVRKGHRSIKYSARSMQRKKKLLLGEEIFPD